MASEAKSREEIQRFRALLEEMRAAEASPQESSSTVLLVVKAARGKDDLFFPTNVDFDYWLNHFELVLRHNSSPQQGCLLGTRRPETLDGGKAFHPHRRRPTD